MSSPKYNRAPHFPWSKGATNDDKIAKDISLLIGQPIVITEKMDGSNTSLEREGCFSRSHASAPTHVSFDMLKVLQASLKQYIPKGIQYFGEWCYAKHSITYDALPNYFLLFGIRDVYVEEFPYWFDWKSVENMAQALGLSTVPVLFEGTVPSQKELQKVVESLMSQPSACGGVREGVVVRVQREFKDSEFSQCVIKNVRANHVQTTEHWKHQELIKNGLKVK